MRKIFQTRDFQNRLKRQLREQFMRQGITRYDPAILDILYFLASVNEEQLLTEEQGRPLMERKGETDAIESAALLLEESANIARRNYGQDVTIDVFVEAYKSKFCSVWPFCR